MDFSGINWLAVIVSTLVAWGLGALWYSKVLFSAAWQKGAGLHDEDIEGANMALIFGTSFVLMFVMILGLALSLNGAMGTEITSPVQGFIHGIIVGVFFVATSSGINYLYQRKSFSLWLIDTGYQVLFLGIAGVILTLWN